MSEQTATYQATPVIDAQIGTFVTVNADELAGKSLALTRALGQLAIARRALTEIANRQEGEMSQARTLHYDMRGWAQRALEAMGDA